MWLALLFVFLAYILDYTALRSKGTFISFIFAVVAFGFAIIALPFITTTNPLMFANQTIMTPSGNIIISGYNQTQVSTQNNLGFMTILGELNAICMFCFVLLIFLLMITDRQTRKYK